MSEVNMAIADLGIVQRGIGRRIGVGTYPPFAETRAGETATERKTRSTEPRATVAHSPRGFQPTHTHNNSIVTWGIDEPTLRRKVADVNDSSEPAKFPGRDFCRRRCVNVHAGVWSLRKSFRSSTMQPGHLVYVPEHIERIA